MKARKLTIVIIITGILAVVVLKIYEQSEVGKANKCQSNRAMIQLATDKWYEDRPSTAITPYLPDLVRHGYLKKAPTCREGGRYYIDYDSKKVICSIHNPQPQSRN